MKAKLSITQTSVFALALIICMTGMKSSIGADATPSLVRGTNIAAWLTSPKRQIYLRDAETIRNAGFDFVRLPIEPEFFHYSLSSNVPAAQQMDFLTVDKAIALMNSAGLDVVLDFHPSTEFKLEVEKGGVQEEHFIEFWTDLANHYKSFSPRTLAFQFLNEPQYYHKESKWAELTRKLVAGVRSQDKEHLIIISAPQGSSIDGLLTVEPINDPHIAYDFHFYEPYIVTHQGAWWFGDSQIRYLQNVRYPTGQVDKSKITVSPGGKQDAAMVEVDKYLDESWDEAHIDSRIKIAADWAHEHNVRLLNLEFGVLITRTDPESRYRWISDVRKAFDANGIGWAVFDYTDSFAIVKPNGTTTFHPEDGSTSWWYPESVSRAIDPAAAKALGLHPRRTVAN